MTPKGLKKGQIYHLHLIQFNLFRLHSSGQKSYIHCIQWRRGSFGSSLLALRTEECLCCYGYTFSCFSFLFREEPSPVPSWAPQKPATGRMPFRTTYTSGRGSSTPENQSTEVLITSEAITYLYSDEPLIIIIYTTNADN